MCVIEAKKDDFEQGAAQCLVEMQACQWITYGRLRQRSAVGARDRDLWDCDQWRGLEVLSAPGGWIGIRIAIAWHWRNVDFTGVVAGIFWVVRTEFELGHN